MKNSNLTSLFYFAKKLHYLFYTSNNSHIKLKNIYPFHHAHYYVDPDFNVFMQINYLFVSIITHYGYVKHYP